MQVGVEYRRPADPRWSSALARLAPKSKFLNWLYVEWFPGDPWEPVERWVVYEMVPYARLKAIHEFQLAMTGSGDAIFEALEGPNPRTLGHYDTVLKKYVYDELPPLVDRRQWDLYRRTRCFARPVWIIQGTTGGHKRAFSMSEIQLLNMSGWPYKQAPAPGELAYAAFDMRVVDQLARQDALRRWHLLLRQAGRFDQRTMRDVWRDRARAEQEFRAELARWLDRQIEDAVRETANTIDMSAAPAGDRRYDHDREDVERAFIEETSTYVPD